MSVPPQDALDACKVAFEQTGANQLHVEGGVITANFRGNPFLNFFGSRLQATVVPTQAARTDVGCDLQIKGHARQRTLLTDYGTLNRLLRRITSLLAEYTVTPTGQDPR
jgi:hypothetical protein